MKKVLTILAASAACVFALNSCSQDEQVFNPSFSNVTAGDDIISFRTNVDRLTRGIETTTGNIAAQGDNDEHVYVTAYYRDPSYDPDANFEPSDKDTYYVTYDEDHEWYNASEKDFTKVTMESKCSDKIMFWDRAYKKDNGSLVLDESDQNPFHWPGSGQYLTFFAYYPSVKYFSDNLLPNNGEKYNNHDIFKCVFDSYYFTRTNQEYVAAPCLKYVAINPDIDKQKDLVVSKPVTDNREGPTPSDANGIKAQTTTLEFEHILSQVVIQAKCPSTSEVGKTYEVKVAGIKVSNPRNLATYDLITGEWHDSQHEYRDVNTNEYIKDNKEYIRGPHTYRFGTGDHNEDAVVLNDTPQSIMGESNAIFTIPVEREKSTLKPNNDQHGMYIGVLLRITRKDNGNVVFPYADDYCYKYEDLQKVIDSDDYLSAIKHYITYKGPDGEYYQWAAIPVEVKWEKGKKYLYTLDFSNGVGYNDPNDGLTQDGGIPVLNGKMNVTCTVGDFDNGNVSDLSPNGEEMEFDKYHK